MLSSSVEGFALNAGTNFKESAKCACALPGSDKKSHGRAVASKNISVGNRIVFPPNFELPDALEKRFCFDMRYELTDEMLELLFCIG